MRTANFLKKSPKDKKEGDIEVTEKIKLPKLKSPGIATKYMKRKKEEFVKDEAEVHPVHSKKGDKEEAEAKEERDTKVVNKVQVPKEDRKAEAKEEGGK